MKIVVLGDYENEFACLRVEHGEIVDQIPFEINVHGLNHSFMNYETPKSPGKFVMIRNTVVSR